MPIINVEQFFKTYNGQPAIVEQAINDDMQARPQWFIQTMGVFPGGQSTVAWVLWQKETKT